jgi:plastocyanin
VSDLSHTVTAAVDGVPEPDAYFASGGFGSEADAREDWEGAREGEIAPGESYRHTFDIRGVYQYFCIPHEDDDMVGFVEVGNPTETGTATSEN